MPRFSSACLLAFAASVVLTACTGPTETGLKARIDAQQRVDLVNAELTYDQAMRNFEVGRFDQARRQIEATIARSPEQPKYHLLLGRILLETHRLEQAQRSFLTAIELDPNNHEAQYFSGIVFQRWSDDEKAYDAYVKASDLEPSNAQYLLAAAESLVALGRLNEAEEMITPRLDYFEHNAAMHHLLAQIATLEGRADDAADLYGRALLLRPDDDLLLEELARAQYAASRYGACLSSLEQIQDRTGMRRADMMLLEARCLTMLQRNIEARDLYIKLTSLRPSDVNVWAELGMIAWEQSNDRRIEECASRVLALAPDRYEGHVLMGIHEQNAGRDDEALRHFRAAASRAGNSATPHMLLGRHLEAMGDTEGALAAYATALRLEPDNQSAQTLFNRIDPSSQITAVPDR